jgi:transcriptional regulator with XRE-family HTH domain
MATKLDLIYEKVPTHTKLMVSKSFDISGRILDILEEKGWTQKDLAEKLSKKESEISKWMKGTHNFTLETIAKIEIALGQTILDTSNSWKQKSIEDGIMTLKTVYADVLSEGGKSIHPTGMDTHTVLYEMKKKISF